MKSKLRIEQEVLSNNKRQEYLIERRFKELVPFYERLCIEVQYILKKQLEARHIEVLRISWRVKSLESFLEKVHRKKYKDPLKDIKDIAGLRVVCFCERDVAKVGKVIDDNFHVLEVVDKRKEKSVDCFGYIGKHYIAELNSEMHGARYEGLEHLVFEVQIRTPFLGLWAEIDHRLVYKHEGEFPDELLRERNRLFAICEELDDRVMKYTEKIEAIADLKKSSFYETEVYALSR